MAVIGSLSVKLGLVTVEWDKATAQAKRQAKDLQGAFKDLGINMQGLKNLFQQLGGAAGLSVAGFAAMARSVLILAGNIDDLSKTYDVSIAKVLQFQNALIQAGGKSEDAGKIIASVFAKISEAQGGNESAIASFERLGITFEQLRAMNPDQALTKVYQGLANIGNTYDRIKAVKEILGKGGLHKSVVEIAEALGQSTAEFKRQEDALKAWAAAGDRIDRMILNLKLAFAEFFQVFTGGDFIPSVNQFKSAMVAITSVLVINGMFKLVTAFKALNTALKSTAALGIALQSAQGIKGIAMAGGALAAYLGAMKVFEGQDKAAAAADEESPNEVITPESTSNGARPALSAQQAKIKLAKEMLDIDRRRHEFQMMFLTGSQDELALGESALKLEEDRAKAKQTLAEALKAENLSAAQMGGIEETYLLDIKKAEQERAQRDELINAKRRMGQDLLNRQYIYETEITAIKNDQLRLENERVNLTSFEYEKQKEALAIQEKILGFEQQRNELKKQWKDSEFSPEFVLGMESINLAESNELGFANIRKRGIAADEKRVKDFSAGWRNAFEQYTKDAENYGQMAGTMFDAVTSNMNAAIDKFVQTGKLGFKDFARSVILDLLAIQMKAQAISMLKMGLNFLGLGSKFPGKAEGGPVTGGQSYMVGERGPELFVPQNSGAIIPNNRLSSMGSTNNVTNNYINAIDTKSFEERLYGSSNAIWAANMYANKSLMINRGRA